MNIFSLFVYDSAFLSRHKSRFLLPKKKGTARPEAYPAGRGGQTRKVTIKMKKQPMENRKIATFLKRSAQAAGTLLLICVLGCSCTGSRTSGSLPGWVAEGVVLTALSGDTAEITAPGGLTLWYGKRLSGPYEIRYSVCVVMRGGEYDRLSDLNCFWAANDPQHPADLFARSSWRDGQFRNYNTLDLFYVGYGGNHNTTTRFRRYHGEYAGAGEAQNKPVLREYADAPHLLEANRWYTVVIRVEEGRTSYSVNGEELFAYPLTPGLGDGHFGLRLLENRVLFTGFRVVAL